MTVQVHISSRFFQVFLIYSSFDYSKHRKTVLYFTVIWIVSAIFNGKGGDLILNGFNSELLNSKVEIAAIYIYMLEGLFTIPLYFATLMVKFRFKILNENLRFGDLFPKIHMMTYMFLFLRLIFIEKEDNIKAVLSESLKTSIINNTIQQSDLLYDAVEIINSNLTSMVF